MTESLEVMLAEAVEAHQQGQLEQAESAYQAILDADPAQADALHFLGVLRHQLGDSEAGLSLLEQALEAAPDYLDAMSNRGNILRDLGRLEPAANAYLAVLNQDPHHLDAANNLGTVLRALERPEEAITLYEYILKHDPRQVNALLNLGFVLRELGRFAEALTAYRLAVEADPASTTAHLQLGSMLVAVDRRDEALTVFRQWQKVDPDNPVLAHMLAACTGEAVPERAADEFVMETFDSFSENFDTVLGRLDYRAPELVSQALERFGGDAAPFGLLCDAGCGTGLVGPLIRDRVERLIGVDLSAGMLGKAKARGCYDELHQGDLEAWLRGTSRPLDAIVSADTLVYLGALEGFFQAAAARVRSDGLLIFTVEHWQPGSDTDDAGGPRTGYRLNPHGRYSHRRAYLEDALSEAGWQLVAIEEETLRLEAAKPVDGLLVTARRR